MTSIDDLAFLYVEDDPLSRQVMQTLIERVMGYKHLYMFEDSRDFRARWLGLPHRPALIFLDIHMQPLSGFDLLQIIRTVPSNPPTLVIALTASVMSEEVEKLKQAGFNGAIAKPLSLDTFPGLVRRILSGEAVWHIA